VNVSQRTDGSWFCDQYAMWSSDTVRDIRVEGCSSQTEWSLFVVNAYRSWLEKRVIMQFMRLHGETLVRMGLLNAEQQDKLGDAAHAHNILSVCSLDDLQRLAAEMGAASVFHTQSERSRSIRSERMPEAEAMMAAFEESLMGKSIPASLRDSLVAFATARLQNAMDVMDLRTETTVVTQEMMLGADQEINPGNVCVEVEPLSIFAGMPEVVRNGTPIIGFDYHVNRALMKIQVSHEFGAPRDNLAGHVTVTHCEDIPHGSVSPETTGVAFIRKKIKPITDAPNSKGAFVLLQHRMWRPTQDAMDNAVWCNPDVVLGQKSKTVAGMIMVDQEEAGDGFVLETIVATDTMQLERARVTTELSKYELYDLPYGLFNDQCVEGERVLLALKREEGVIRFIVVNADDLDGLQISSLPETMSLYPYSIELPANSTWQVNWSRFQQSMHREWGDIGDAIPAGEADFSEAYNFFSSISGIGESANITKCMVRFRGVLGRAREYATRFGIPINIAGELALNGDVNYQLIENFVNIPLFRTQIVKMYIQHCGIPLDLAISIINDQNIGSIVQANLSQYHATQHQTADQQNVGIDFMLEQLNGIPPAVFEGLLADEHVVAILADYFYRELIQSNIAMNGLSIYQALLRRHIDASQTGDVESVWQQASTGFQNFVLDSLRLAQSAASAYASFDAFITNKRTGNTTAYLNPPEKGGHRKKKK